MSRDDVAQILAKALPESAAIRYGETVGGAIDKGDKIEAKLGSGETIEADLLIGADGIRSSIRGQFWNGEECLENLGYNYAVYDVEDKKELETDCVSFNRPAYLDVLYSLRNDRLAALHIWRDDMTELKDGKPKFETVREVTAGARDTVKEILQLAETAGATPLIDSLTMVTLPQWSKGRVLLLGDAAHCLTLLSGQGAGMAIASAEILGRELMATKDIAQALANHEKKLRPITERLQKRTRDMASMYIPKGRFMYWFRNLLLKIVPYRWIVSWHVSSIKQEIDLTQR